MFRIGAALALAMISVAALAAGQGSGKDAAPAVQGLLSAAAAGDAAGFEAAIDRPALRADLRRQLIDIARENEVEVEGGPSDAALDRRIGPEIVRLAAADAGPVGDHLKKIGKAQVCLTGEGPAAPCLLTFAKTKGKPGWRLVGMQAPARSVDVGVDLGS
jgi:hypothetical protein